jgi:hypothetical protein
MFDIQLKDTGYQKQPQPFPATRSFYLPSLPLVHILQVLLWGDLFLGFIKLFVNNNAKNNIALDLLLEPCNMLCGMFLILIRYTRLSQTLPTAIGSQKKSIISLDSIAEI